MAALIVIACVLATAAIAHAGIYPDGHWDYSTELSTDNAESFVKENVDAGRTVFIRWIPSEDCSSSLKQAPSWNKVIEDFASHPGVVFGDVLLSKNQVRELHGVMQYPGTSGWPSLRHFNKGTGYGGKAYEKKTKRRMCDELGPEEEYLQEYVEQEGGVELCSIKNAEQGCTEQQKTFIAKWFDKPKQELKKEHYRITQMLQTASSAMKPESLKWAKQRASIIKQLMQKQEL